MPHACIKQTMADSQLAEDVEIENCSGNVIDIQENANNTIICKGFRVLDTIVWTLAKSDGEILKVTCYPVTCDEYSPGTVNTCDFYCNGYQSDHFAVERSQSNSTLFYQQYDREVDKNATVSCESHSGTSKRTKWCHVNVIHTNRPVSTRGTTTATSSLDVSPLPDSVDYTSPRTQEENDLPMGALVGGIVAGVAVIIIVVVVVVVCVRRKRKQKPAGSALGSSNDTATENDDFEEHVSPMYSTSDGPDASQQNDENTYEVPAHRPPNAEPEHVYNDSNTATTTTTTTPSHSIATTTGDLRNTTTNQRRGHGKKSDNVHHNPVYVNENPPGEESSGLQQHPTYANDHHQTAQGDVDANRDSNPYEIKDTGIN
ncbi:conserved oligomeric Golgi complex subunit 8-like [Littorina saxatilis]|uniref:conserved oligomeric Golgi complex subunit 8-like n=1 Tax=Littorina saxatilis TaxID=31220 RepID=UPI0038B61AFF